MAGEIGTPTKQQHRSELTYLKDVDTTQRRQPKAWEYYVKSVIIGTLGEAAYRLFNLTDSISFKKLDDLTDISKIVTFAKAEEVVNAAGKNVTAVAEETCGEYFFTFACDSWNCIADFGNNTITNVSVFLCENSDWLLLTGGIAFTAASVNHLASGKIKNVYVRNTLSLFLGGAAAWGAATAMGYPVSISDTADIGLRLLVTNGIGKFAACPGQSSLKLLYAGLSTLRWDFSYPAIDSKIKVS